jgi:mono/diheme cytochrome c family protein
MAKMKAAFLVALPFIDKRLERRPWKRPVASFSFAIVFCSLIFLGWQSGHEDSTDGSVAKQLTRQDSATLAFMKTPFTPELSGGTLAAQNAALLDPSAAKGKKVFSENSCDGCHGDNAEGTDKAPKLIGVSAKYDHDKLISLLKTPTPKMRAGDMDPVEISDEDMNLLLSYLSTLK